LALEGGGWSAPCSDRFAPRKDPLPIVQEAGGASGLVWTAQKISPTPGLDPWTVWSRVTILSQLVKNFVGAHNLAS